MNIRRSGTGSRRQSSSASELTFPPTLSGISPTSGDQWDPASVTATGTGFATNSKVYVAGTMAETTYVSSTSLTFVVPGAAAWALGTKACVVVNPSGAESESRNYTVGIPSDEFSYKDAHSGIEFGNEGLLAWADRTGDADKEARQETDADQPAWDAGNDAAFNFWERVIDASNDSMATGTFASPLAQPYTHILAARAPVSKAAKHAAVDGLDGSHRGSIYAAQTTGYVGIHAGTALETSVVWSGNVMIVVAEFNGANSKIWVNRYGTPDASGNAGSHSLTGLMYLKDTAGNFWGGDLAMSILKSGVMSASVREQLVKALADKYALTVTS